MMFGWVLLSLLVCLLRKGEAIWLTVPASGTKCVSEELHNNVVVLADYFAISDDHSNPIPTISVKVMRTIGLRALQLINSFI